jgi:hypothetical protein
MRALERDMTERWPSAGDLLAALQRYLYSLDDPPGPRDVAALVARYCPPSTRRLPTHLDDLADSDPSPATQPRPRAASVADEPRPGPSTAVIPRDAAGPRGKRPTRARTQTFATHVELEQILERGATPSPEAAAGAGARASDASDPTQTSPGADDHRDDPAPSRPGVARRADRATDAEAADADASTANATEAAPGPGEPSCRRCRCRGELHPRPPP